MDINNQTNYPLFRKLFNFDKICFKSCVKKPEKEFS